MGGGKKEMEEGKGAGKKERERGLKGTEEQVRRGEEKWRKEGQGASSE